MKQLHAFFSGHVQGVGFRYTAQQVARQFSVSGWIKNLKDGQVELVAEGEESELQQFLAALRERMDRHIQDVEVKWKEAAGQFKHFEIAY